MIYPSHFTARIFGFDGEPNALRFEAVRPSLESTRTKMSGQDHTLRARLQDYAHGEPEHGVSDVRAKMEASADEVGFGYLLWNANAEYTTEALDDSG